MHFLVAQQNNKYTLSPFILQLEVSKSNDTIDIILFMCNNSYATRVLY